MHRTRRRKSSRQPRMSLPDTPTWLPAANFASPTTAAQGSAPSRRSRRDARPASRCLFDVLDDRDSRVDPRKGILSRIPPECVPRNPPIVQPSVAPWRCAAPGSHFVRGCATWSAGFRRRCNGRELPALVRYRAAVLVHGTDAPGEDKRLVGWQQRINRTKPAIGGWRAPTIRAERVRRAATRYIGRGEAASPNTRSAEKETNRKGARGARGERE